MLNEFLYGHQIYRIRRELDLDAPDEEVVLFKNLDVAQAFFRNVGKDRFAREDLMNVAKWVGIAKMNSNNTYDSEMVQQTLEQLCLKIWAGDLLLVEIKVKPIIQFKKCCIQSIDAINRILESGKKLSQTLLASKLVLLFFSRSKGNKLVDMVSMLDDFVPTSPSPNDWVMLAKAMMSVSVITRKRVYDVAGYEIRDHIKDNKRELRAFWKGVRDASA